MWWPAIVGSAVTLALACLAVAVGWGRLNRSQESIVEAMKDMAAELKKLPALYVSLEMDKQRQKWLDERDAAQKDLLNDIKVELKELGRKKT